eukprot:TRINITY_DN726_c0_g1_i1.p1 TRINITY_DN726_c0_g1~~TRINITY_DN726_c0_g1_i1.p1  ORF type:complete len:527 (+),score=78.96 TRINITY_DN726_c0_g1_i1:84-1583(+)
MSVVGCHAWEENGCVKVDPGSTVTFATDSGATVDIETNEVPSGGTCTVTPAIGIELETEFTLTCEGWADLDKPLTYTFELLPVYSYREGIGSSCESVGLSAASFQEATFLSAVNGIQVFSRDVSSHQIYSCRSSSIRANPIDDRYLETGIGASDSTGGIILRSNSYSNQIKFRSARGAHYIRAFISDALGVVTKFQQTISVTTSASEVADPIAELSSLASQVAAARRLMTIPQRNTYMDVLTQLVSSRRHLQESAMTSNELAQIAGIAFALVEDATVVDRSKIYTMSQLLSTVVSLSSSAPESKTMDTILRAVEALTAASIFGSGDSPDPLRDAELLHSVVTNVAHTMVAGKLLGEDGFRFLSENLTIISSRQATDEVSLTNCGAGVFQLKNLTSAISDPSVSCAFVEEQDLNIRAVTGSSTQANVVSLDFKNIDFSIMDYCSPIIFTLENYAQYSPAVHDPDRYDFRDSGSSFEVPLCAHFDYSSDEWSEANCTKQLE